MGCVMQRIGDRESVHNSRSGRQLATCAHSLVAMRMRALDRHGPDWDCRRVGGRQPDCTGMRRNCR